MADDREGTLCSSCGATVGSRDRFCDQCGIKLRTESQAPDSIEPDDSKGPQPDREALTTDRQERIAKAKRLGTELTEEDQEILRLEERLAAKEREIQDRLEERRKAEESERQRAEKAALLESLSEELEKAEEKLGNLDRYGTVDVPDGDPDTGLILPKNLDALPDVEKSGWWLLWEIASEGKRQGNPLTLDEADLLQSAPPSLGADLNNKVVKLARRAMDRAKEEGAPTTRFRSNLSVPTKWVAHYQTIDSKKLRWNLTRVMQNSMNQNVIGGESSNWVSP